MRWMRIEAAAAVLACVCACPFQGAFSFASGGDGFGTVGSDGGVTSPSTGSDDGPISTVFASHPDSSPADDSSDGDDASTTSTTHDGTTMSTGSSTGDDRCVPDDACTPAACIGQTYDCGDCVDNDGDDLVDAEDPECWGPCSNNEAGFEANVPADDGNPPCVKADCYFDFGTGMSGNDDCHWVFGCDPLQPYGCTYDPDASIPGAGDATCEQLAAAQSQQCLDTCLPMTPNGCDCFGCCEVHVESGVVTIFLGSNIWGDASTSCSLATAEDPSICHPCTLNTACHDECDTCELCLGKTSVPDDCTPAEQCPGGEQPCGLDCQDSCPAGSFCVTGCCRPDPR